MAVHEDGWLAGVLAQPVFRVDAGSEFGALKQQLTQHLSAQHVPAFYFAKVDTADVEIVRLLSGLGFYVVDVNVTLELSGAGAPSQQNSDVTVATQRAADAEGVLDIAGSAFRYSRFHLDPQVGAAAAHRVKREWMANYVNRSRGEDLLVAHLDGRVAGFLAVIGSGPVESRTRAIDLIAVDPSAQGRGVGRALVQAFVNRYAATSERLQVGTQIANAPSLGLYQKLGFEIRRSAYVMHLHSAPGSRPS